MSARVGNVETLEAQLGRDAAPSIPADASPEAIAAWKAAVGPSPRFLLAKGVWVNVDALGRHLGREAGPEDVAAFVDARVHA